MEDLTNRIKPYYVWYVYPLSTLMELDNAKLVEMMTKVDERLSWTAHQNTMLKSCMDRLDELHESMKHVETRLIEIQIRLDKDVSDVNKEPKKEDTCPEQKPTYTYTKFGYIVDGY